MLSPALRILLFAVPFSVRRMFFMGEPGLHLEAITPEQNAVNPTMFQDSAGTTPITAIEQPVGLWLDSKLGAVRGADLRTSGAAGLLGSATAASFNTGTGAGSVTRVDASNQSYVQFSGLTASRWYEIRFSAVAGGTLQVRNGNETATVVASFTGSGQCIVNTAGTTITLTASAAATVTFTCAAVQIIPGNHVSQSSAGARPTYTRRVNALRGTEALTGADWTTNGSGAVTSGFSDPNGGTTAFRIVTSTAVINSGIYQNALTITSASQVESVWLRGNAGGEQVQIGDATNRTTVTLTTSWQRFTGTVIKLSANFVIYSNSLAQTWFAWRPDSRPASIAALSIPAYQRVTSSTDYDTEGFPCMVKGNGTSQWMSGTLDMSSTDKVLVVAGVTKYSDAAAALCELTASSSANNGSFAMFAPGSAAPRFFWRSRGTAGADADSASSFAAPYPAVVTGQGDIAADVSTLRVNGATAASSATDQGTGNYANSTLYLFARGGTGSWSSAGITSLTIRGGDGSAWVSRLENYAKNLMKLVY